MFHTLVDNKGPTLNVIRSSTGRVFGCFISGNITSANTNYADANAFIFQLDNLVKLPVLTPTNSYAYWGTANSLIYLGPSSNPDLVIASGGTNSVSYLGYSY